MHDPGIGAADFGTIGAYERDNFGDLLFWRAVRHYAPPSVPIATSPFPGLVDEHLGARVYSYTDVIAERPDLPMLVIGGEVGGTRLQQALNSYSDEEVAGRMDVRHRMRSYASPYLLRESDHPIALNSVGIDGMRTLHGSRLGYVARALASAEYLSVRERASSECLRRLGLRHSVAPDAVHTIPRWHSVPERATGHIIFQMKGVLLDRADPEEVARLILSACGAGETVVLMAAGLAPGHDSAAAYERVRAVLNRRSPRTPVKLHLDPDPLAKVTLIASANLWIGTSLHGLIVSTSYGVPSVSLMLRKLSIYGRAWALPMPIGVPLRDGAAAVRAARRFEGSQILAQTSSRLADAAERSMKDAVESLSPLPGDVKHAKHRTRIGFAGASVVARARLLY